MQLKPGARLRSAVCATEFVVIKSPPVEIDMRCGGHPVTGLDVPLGAAAAPKPAFTGGTLLGKRYTLESLGLELLVTKGGAGSLSIGEEILEQKEAKKLPSSD